MAKNAIIFHGTENTPEDYWYPWLGQKLESRGFNVEIPHYPELNQEPTEETIAKVLAAHRFDRETVLVGHSAGGPLILSILERLEEPVDQAVLVAGFCSPLPDGENPVLQDEYDWQKIKTNAGRMVLFNSVNDPWGCNDAQGRAIFDNLDGQAVQVIMNDGHFGSTTFDQPYREFPMLERVIL